MTKARTLADLLDSSGDVKSSALDNATSSLSDLSVTATASELNTLDGITASTAELNLMDGVTATTAEINHLDGVTSNVQTQIDGISSEVVDDTTPSLGGDLLTNGSDIKVADSDRIYLGTGNDFELFHDGSNTYLAENTGTGNVYLRGNNLTLLNNSNESYVNCVSDGAVSLYHNNSQKFRTTANGIETVGGTNINMSSSADGQIRIDGSGYAGAIALNGTNMHIYTNSGNRGISLGTNETERLGINGNGSWRKAPAGTVLQVKSTTSTGSASYNNASWNTISSLSITPKSTSSKILVISTISFGGGTISGSWNGFIARMLRGSTAIAKGTSTSGNQQTDSTYGGLFDKHYHRTEPHTQHFLDSPSTTSAVTYSMQVTRTSYIGGTIQFNYPSNRSSIYSASGVTTLTLMEIAG